MTRTTRYGLLAGLTIAICPGAVGLSSGAPGATYPLRSYAGSTAPVRAVEPDPYPPGPVAYYQGADAGVVTRPLVIVLDGAGDFGGCSHALQRSNAAAGNPVEMTAFPWSHGKGRIIIDQMDMDHAREQGRVLATVVAEHKRQDPWRRVVLVGHSAGCAVALAAGEVLPPDSIDRMILLAPSVSTGYDLRPSLRASREGIDAFSSKRDYWALGLGARLVGTVDRYWAPAAGRHGFGGPQCQIALTASESLRFRQHMWSPALEWTGHHGGHFGSFAPAFVRAFLLPLLDPACVGYAP